MGAAAQPARAGQPAAFAYARRRPEETTLYRVVAEELETFLAQVQAHTGSDSPQFVKDEFEAFLECGILAHGFLRVRCADCAHEKLVAFSCKRRGFCPSCGARRMAETAAYLVDRVIARVPVRQWVLSFPIPLRILFAAHPELLTPALGIVHRVITGFLLKQAGLKRATADTGAVTLIQRFGSAANLNIHLHCLVLDWVYRGSGDEVVFHDARAPSGDELEGLLEKIVARLMRMLTGQGYLIEEPEMTYLADIPRIIPWRHCKRPRALIASLSVRAPEGRCSVCAPWPGATRNPRSFCAPRRTGSACTLSCAVTRISAKSSNGCAATSPALRSPTNA